MKLLAAESAHTSPTVLLNPLDFIRWSFSVLARLIDDGCCQQLRRVEVADGKAFEPGLLPAGEAMKLCSPDVPQLDVNAV